MRAKWPNRHLLILLPIIGGMFATHLGAAPISVAVQAMNGTWYRCENFTEDGIMKVYRYTVTVNSEKAAIRLEILTRTSDHRVARQKSAEIKYKVDGNEIVSILRGHKLRLRFVDDPDVLIWSSELLHTNDLLQKEVWTRNVDQWREGDEMAAILQTRPSKPAHQGSTFGAIMQGVAQGLAAYGGQQYPTSTEPTSASTQIPQTPAPAPIPPTTSRPVSTPPPTTSRPVSTPGYPAQPPTMSTRNTSAPTIASAPPRSTLSYPGAVNTNNPSPQTAGAQSDDAPGVAASQCVSVSLIQGSKDEYGLKNSCNSTIYVTFCVQNDKDVSSCKGTPGLTNVNANSIEYTLPFYTGGEVIWAACIAPATPWGFKPVLGAEFTCSVVPPGPSVPTSGHAASSAH